MKNTKIFSLILSLAVLILEIIPYGATCIFMGDPAADITVKYTYSYFDLTPFGYANFGPLITAVLTCLITATVIISLFGKFKTENFIFILGAAATVTSLMPLLYGLPYYNAVAAAITILLAALTVAQKVPKK